MITPTKNQLTSQVDYSTSSAGIVSGVIRGIGLRAMGLKNVVQYVEQDFRTETQKDFQASLSTDIMPARERRRAPLAVRLAMEVAHQACSQASIQAEHCMAVFASGAGDADTLQQLYKSVNSDQRHTSPTGFHNSVHNAASGYWSISTGCKHAVSFVSSGDYSVSVGLLEALVQVNITGGPVLLVVYDVASPELLKRVHANHSTFAAAFLISKNSVESLHDSDACEPFHRNISAELVVEGCEWPTITDNKLANVDPDEPTLHASSACRALILVDAWASESDSTIGLPLSAESSLQVHVSR